MFPLLLTAVLSPAAFPCAGLFHEEGKLAESGHQEVLLEQGEGEVRATYNVIYDGDSADFGWVIAVPGQATALEDGDLELIEALREASAATVSWYYDTGDEPIGCACGAAKSGGDNALGADTADARGGVEILAEGFTGTYDYSLVAATDASELVTWLEDNGWSAGGSEGELEDYVAEGWTFAALKVSPDEALTADEGTGLPPVTVVYEGELAYPARMALSGSVAEQRTTIYVLGDQRARLSDGWSEQELAELYGSVDQDPLEVLQDALWDIGGDQPVYAVTYSYEYEGRWLTRFDTFAAREVHTADPVFALDAGETKNHLYIELTEGGTNGRRSHRGLLLLLPLAGIGWSLGRRSG